MHASIRPKVRPKPFPQTKQVYGGVKTEADADQLVQAVGTSREGALRPLVLDVSKPESLPAVVAKVKAELGTVRTVVEWELLWVSLTMRRGFAPPLPQSGTHSLPPPHD